MARPTNDKPKFISVNIQNLRIIAEQLGDRWAEWSIKALDDMILGCVRNDVDPIVRECYEHAIGRLSLKQEQNRRAYKARKEAPSASSTSLAPINGSKRNDQLIWGRFENVFLSQDEYNTLATDFGNINLLNQTIESFSASMADGKTQSQNHFATLTRWIAWRKSQEQQTNSAPHYESVSEHNRRVREQSHREIEMLAEQGYLK